MVHTPREEPLRPAGEGSASELGSTRLGVLGPDGEEAMEMLLAACLAMPRPRLESAIEEACTLHPHLAPHLRHRYQNLLEMGILEQHENEEGISGESAP